MNIPFPSSQAEMKFLMEDFRVKAYQEYLHLITGTSHGGLGHFWGTGVWRLITVCLTDTALLFPWLYFMYIFLSPGRRSHDVTEANFHMTDRAHERVCYCILISPGNKT